MEIFRTYHSLWLELWRRRLLWDGKTHIHMRTPIWGRGAHDGAIMLVVEMRRIVATQKRQVSKSFVWRMTHAFVCMCLLYVEPCSVCARFWPVSHLPVLMVIFGRGTHMNGCVTSWGATFLFVIPAACSEEMNGGRWRRIRDTVEQGKAQPGVDCIFPLTELIKGTRDWLGSA